MNTQFSLAHRSLLAGLVTASLLMSLPSALAAGPPTTAPTDVRASAGPETAGIGWTGVSGDVTQYTVTASPGGKQCTVAATSSTCWISELAPGSYTFTVAAGNSYGMGPSSAASAPVTVYPIPPDPSITMKRLSTKVTSSKVKFRTEVTVSPAGKIRQKVVSSPDMNAAKKWLQCRTSQIVEEEGTYSLTCPMGADAREALRKKAMKVEVTTWLKPIPFDEGISVKKTWKINRHK